MLLIQLFLYDCIDCDSKLTFSFKMIVNLFPHQEDEIDASIKEVNRILENSGHGAEFITRVDTVNESTKALLTVEHKLVMFLFSILKQMYRIKMKQSFIL